MRNSGAQRASMRPGLIHPGNAQAADSVACGDRSGFNEARADSPGKLDRRRAIQCGEGDELASMRPGLIHPGNTGPGRQIWRRESRTASMRPGLIHPGNSWPFRPSTVSYSRPEYHASMRPGLIHPGNARIGRPADDRRRYLASMRPGLIHPGNPARPARPLLDATSCWLQ